ncbi:MAG: hypothetical protein WBQ75_15135, partial [Acetobacteraceae bacterium]
LDGSRVIVHGTKSEASDRVVALPAFVVQVQAFRRQRKLQIEERLASDVWADPDLVFASTVGTGLDRWRVRDWWNGLAGWRVSGLVESPITGPDGNREFLIAAVRD